MNEMKKSPDANAARKDKELESSLVDLAEEYFESRKPVLRHEGTQLLVKRLAITT